MLQEFEIKIVSLPLVSLLFTVIPTPFLNIQLFYLFLYIIYIYIYICMYIYMYIYAYTFIYIYVHGQKLFF